VPASTQARNADWWQLRASTTVSPGLHVASTAACTWKWDFNGVLNIQKGCQFGPQTQQGFEKGLLIYRRGPHPHGGAVHQKPRAVCAKRLRRRRRWSCQFDRQLVNAQLGYHQLSRGSSTLNIIWSCGLFEGKGLSSPRVSPSAPLSLCELSETGPTPARLGCAPRDSGVNATSKVPGFPLARGSAWAGGRDHTPSRVPPQRWGTTSCREAAPLPHLRG
jgi:hypothetical protein